MAALPSTTPQIAKDHPQIVNFAGLIFSSCICFAAAYYSHWTRIWLFSGTVVENLILLFGPASSHAPIPAWVLLFGLNIAFAIASTSWLLLYVYAVGCWILVALSCLVQYAAVSSWSRARLRRLSEHLHLYRDKVAFLRMPTILLDFEVGGQFTLQAIAVSILELRVEIVGIAVSKWLSTTPGV
jgi:hypothetical protein